MPSTFQSTLDEGDKSSEEEVDADAETILGFTTDDIVTEQGDMAGLMVPEKNILARHR